VIREPKEFKNNVGGPGTMVAVTAQAVQNGFWRVMQIAGLLSISVGIMNLLPAPPLDGGQMLMCVVEMFRRGRRLSIRAQAIASGIGMSFVFALIIGVLVVDVQRFMGPKDPVPVKSAPAKK